MTKRIGVDVDGVLAEFNASFIDRVIQITGRDLFPPRPFDIPTWNYPEHYGYTADEVSAAWQNIKNDPTFWYDLSPYPDTQDALAYLCQEQRMGHAIYFITARPGLMPKQQTERWFAWEGFARPTVLISSAKGLCARALDLTHYIDDRWENVVDVRQYSPTTETFLMTRSWNAMWDAESQGIHRVTHVDGFAS